MQGKQGRILYCVMYQRKQIESGSTTTYNSMVRGKCCKQVQTAYHIYLIRWRATIYLVARFVRLLFEGGVYFFGKSGDINNSWIRHVRAVIVARHCQQYVQPLSPAVSRCNDSYNTNSPSASVVTIIRNHSHMCARAAFTSRSYYLRVAFISFKSFGLCGYYLRVVSIRRNTVSCVSCLKTYK